MSSRVSWIKQQNALSRLRGQPQHSNYIQEELDELVANYEYEVSNMRSGWADCFNGGWKPNGNFRRVVVGIVMQMMQQWSKLYFDRIHEEISTDFI